MASSGGGDSDRRSSVRQQEVVAELGRRALETDDVDDMLHDVTATVADTLDAEYSYVLESSPDGDELLLREGVGWHDGVVGDATVPTGRGSQAGATLASMEATVVDGRRVDRFSGDELLVDHDVGSGVTVPIGTAESPWGVLGAFSADQREFTAYDAAFLRSVANVLAATVARSRKERQLHERETQLDVTTDAASIGIWSWDIQEDVVTADEFLAKSYGVDPDVAAEGASMETFYEPIHEDDTAATRERLDRALETGELEAEYRVRDADGDVMWVVARGEVEFDEHGDPVRLNGAIADITERKRREQALEESEARYRDLFTSMSEGYCVIERVQSSPEEPVDFRYVEANPAFEENTGIEDVVGETLRDVVPKETQKWVDTYDSVVRTGEPITFERELVAQGRTLECYAFPVGDEAAEQVGVVFTDVTRRVEYERRLEELVDELEASNERLEQFAYAASHDLQEPLRMVTSYLQLVEKRYADELDEDGREFIEFAVDGAERMREMIDGLLEYSRIETEGDPFEPVDLDGVLDDVTSDLQLKIQKQDAEITVDDLPRVHGDEGQLRQVFQNLLDNAVEYSGDEPPRIHVTAERDGEMWRLSVHDEGMGIEPEQQARVFEVFQRLHTHEEHAGMGIGLALCQRIVERHEGDIWVDSEPGEGATFSFTLPSANGRET